MCVQEELGRSDFNRLHTGARRKCWYEGADLVVYCALDVLMDKGKALRAAALERRKASLARLLRAHSDRAAECHKR